MPSGQNGAKRAGDLLPFANAAGSRSVTSRYDERLEHLRFSEADVAGEVRKVARSTSLMAGTAEGWSNRTQSHLKRRPGCGPDPARRQRGRAPGTHRR